MTDRWIHHQHGTRYQDCAGNSAGPAQQPGLDERAPSLRARGGGTLQRLDGARFGGSLEEWHRLHLERCREVKPTGRHAECEPEDSYCSPLSPCDGCWEWARRRCE
jgi:hypothetical protein